VLEDSINQSTSKSNTTKYLSPEHIKSLSVDSAIPDEIIKARGYQTVTDPLVLTSLGFGNSQCIVPGLLIPSFDVVGSCCNYHYRPDNPRAKYGRVIKYEFPARGSLSLDIPVLSRDLIGQNVSVWITEGLKKADALSGLGLCAIGLFGTWCFRGKNGDSGGYSALPDWESIPMEFGDKDNGFGRLGRDIYIVFDSDCIEKEGVFMAMERLGAFLSRRGGRVKCVILPSLVGGGKCGVDDWIAAQGSREGLFDKLIALSGPLPPNPFKCGGIGELNELVCINANPPDTVTIIKNGTILPVHKMTSSRYASDEFMIMGEDKPARAWKHWLVSKDASRVEEHMMSADYPPLSIYEDKDGVSLYNPFRGLAIRPQPIENPEETTGLPYHCWLWFDNLTGGYPEYWTEFNDLLGTIAEWIKYPLGQDGKRAQYGIVFVSDKQGIGKSLLGKLVAIIFGSHHAKYLPASELFKDFPNFPPHTLFTSADELKLKGKFNEDHHNALKILIGSETRQWAMKGIQPYEIPNMARFYFTANSFCELKADRRFLVYQPPYGVKTFDEINKQADDRGEPLNLYNEIIKELPQFLTWLINRKTTIDIYSKPPSTIGSENLEETSNDPTKTWLIDYMSITTCTDYGIPIKKITDDHNNQNPDNPISTKSIGMHLSQLGIRKLRGGTNYIKVTLYKW